MKTMYIADLTQLVMIWTSGVIVGIVLATVFHFAEFLIYKLLGWC